MCLLGSSGPWAGSTSVSSPVEWDAQGLHPWRAGTLRWRYICNPWACAATVLTLLILCPQQMLVWRKELQKCRKKRERRFDWAICLFFSVVCFLLEKVVFSIISSLNNFFIILFIYLWLCWVFVAAWAFLKLWMQRLATLQLQCRGFLLWWLLLSWSTGSVVVEHGLSGCGAPAQWLWSTGSVALEHLESSRTGDWTGVSYFGRQMLNYWATREVPKQLLKTEV